MMSLVVAGFNSSTFIIILIIVLRLITFFIKLLMKAMTVSLENQKKALELKFLVESTNSENKQLLVEALNRIYPFTEYPLKSAPPIEFFQTHTEQLIGNNLLPQLQNHSFIIITGGLVVSKGQHQFVENRFLAQDTLQEIVFNVKQEGVTLKALPSSCYIRIHNIWINMAKKQSNSDTQDYIKQKLFQVPFFANLSFQQFNKICKAAYLMMLGPGDVLLKLGQVPYNMYVVVEGELVFEKKVKLVKDKQLWLDVINQLQREEDNTCELMFDHLVKDPRPKDQVFQVIFKLKNINQKEIICAKETLCQEALTYNIISSLKTKLICLKYPDFYLLSSQVLAEIRLWPIFVKDEIELRRDYYYQMKWQDFKQQVKRQSKLNKLQKKRFQDFLRKAVNLSQEKHYYCPHKVGEGNIIDSPASKVSKLKSMTYKQYK